MTAKPVTLIICGAGDRGTGHAANSRVCSDAARVVGVAEPRQFHRERLVKTHGIPESNAFHCWTEMARRERFADAVVITTQDAMHVGPAEAFAAKGYHILLEKPMAPDEEGCRRIIKAVTASKRVFAVGHVLRYTGYTQKIKQIVDSGVLGEIVSIQHLEPVSYWHQAHSYVRGNWRNEKESSCMLLAKSCHDIDWIHYMMGSRCRSVSSFGSLKHFRPECQPAGAADRCLDCAVEAQCPFSAKRIYMERLAKGQTGWPLSVVVTDPTRESLMEALRTGPYGRCVYRCDNDVVDHQVVNMNFDSGATASFTMTAFTKSEGRQTRIFGTRGQLTGNSSVIEVFDFLTEKVSVTDTRAPDGTVTGGHGGGDHGLMRAFLDAVAHDDPGRVLTGPQETLDSHLMVFAAERSRRENRIVNL